MMKSHSGKLKWRGHTTTCGRYRISVNEDKFGKMWYAQEICRDQWYPVSSWQCNTKERAKGEAQKHFNNHYQQTDNWGGKNQLRRPKVGH